MDVEFVEQHNADVLPAEDVGSMSQIGRLRLAEVPVSGNRVRVVGHVYVVVRREWVFAGQIKHTETVPDVILVVRRLGG